jgi:tetratricopeptide (TPR) repeat protein
MKKLAVITLLCSILTACPGSKGEFESDPGNSFSHHYYLGMAAFEKQDYREAIRHFKRSIRLNPNIPRTHNELGMCYLQIGEYENAIDSFGQALSLDPNMVEAHNSLGVAHLFLKHYDIAERHLRIVLNSTDYQTPFIPLYNLGNLYYQQGQLDKALELYFQATENENNVSLEYQIFIHFQIGKIFFDKRRFSESFDEFDRVLLLNPKIVEASLKGGISAYYIGKNDRARSLLNKVISIDPDSEAARTAREYLNKLDK